MPDEPQKPENGDDPLEFKVASHIVEDLGLNLYTSLPRVLVEFVANAYDADSPFVDIAYDRSVISAARKAVKAEFQRERALAEGDLVNGRLVRTVQPLESRTLGDDAKIVVVDGGLGMTRDDLKKKFLVAGRRRRLEDPSRQTDKGRAIMGRKGLGKLAGFGVAKKVEVLSRAAGSDFATLITLRYDDLVKSETMDRAFVPEEKIQDPPGLSGSGTIVTLSELLYDPTKSRDDTIESEIADHFSSVSPIDFEIRMNRAVVRPTPKTYAFAWPNPELPADQFVSAEAPVGDPENPESGDAAENVRFLYRIRFVALGKGLNASDRGVRIYANNRLAAAASLLDADTNVHGFKMSSYLDGVAHADFIDEQPADYIATDRQGLRWDAPLLAGMRKFLSQRMSEAIRAYQNTRDAVNDEKVKKDSFTKQVIAGAELASSDKKICLQVAKELAKAYDGVDSSTYKTTLPILVHAIGHGGILTAIDKLANEDNPELSRVVAQITRLTRDELEAFTKRAKARLRGIEALKKATKAADKDNPENEKEIQRLFEKSPWLVDATYTDFVSADEREDTMFYRLAKELKIDKHAPTPIDAAKRPDLVFLLGNEKLARLVIVELKSMNKSLDVDHLMQLQRYMRHAEKWLQQLGRDSIRVEGHLIGTFAAIASHAEKVESLRIQIDDAGPSTAWRVREYLSVLNDTEAAHLELLDIQKATPADEAPDSE